MSINIIVFWGVMLCSMLEV